MSAPARTAACLPWFHPVREAAGAAEAAGPAAGYRLVFFPSAGSSASSGWALEPALPEGWALWSAQYPARGPRLREPQARSVRELAEGCLPALAETRERIVLFGHSFGAYVAYDVARQLESLGRPAAGLVVSGIPAPGTALREVSPDELSDARLRTFLAGQGVASAELLADEELMEMVLPVLRADLYLARSYVDDYSGTSGTPILGLGGRGDPLISRGQLRSWCWRTRTWLGDELADGGHFYYLGDPAFLAGTLERHWPSHPSTKVAGAAGGEPAAVSAVSTSMAVSGGVG